MLTCISCSKKNLKLLYKIKKFPLFWGAIPKTKLSSISYPFELSYCKDCGLVQQSKLLDEKIINKVYTAKYYACPSPIISGMGVSEIDKFLNFFYKCKNKPGKILEIGCFDGYLLENIKKKNWDVYGCDPSSMTNLAIKRLGKKRIKKIFFKKSAYSRERFDFIIFRNLISLIYKPNLFLKTIYETLNENGKIFIDLPNFKEIIKVGGFGLFFHQHVNYFTLKSLNNLLIKNNFKITKYFEGKPNMFVEAKKLKKKSEIIIKNYDLELLKKLDIKSKNIRNKVLRCFQNDKINKIILFGASAVSTTIMGMLNSTQKEKIILFVDNDLEKQGKYLSGSNFQIKSPKEIKNKNFDIVFLTSHFFIKEIKKQLSQMGIPNNKIKNI